MLSRHLLHNNLSIIMDKLRSIEILTIEQCLDLKPLFDNGLGVITMQKSIDRK
ncbi:hypothetical protein [Pseudanabaena sp. SR411]|uniref:hypothetical protein n=1 Tax=Pseudanabaena sp. SR411 TaxID=1980935 RepID=UPI001595B71A|nr:hypothetical protein [Pseudanabaena sp. SR411]